MYILHVVAVSGGAGWGTGLLLWLVTGALGGGFAQLAGEANSSGALLTDLALAGAGGALANLMARPLGTDVVAYLFGVRVVCTAFGSVVLLIAAHDLVPLLIRAAPRPLRVTELSEVGGVRYLFTWLSGWPFGPGGIEACYAGKLRIKLIDGVLHYQIRRGPFIGSETVLLESGTVGEIRDGGLRIIVESRQEPEQLELKEVHPVEQLVKLVAAINHPDSTFAG